MFLLWTLKSNGRPCPGVYRINADKTLTGTWGYGGEVTVEPDGSLSGDTHAEEIHPPRPPVPFD